jgi:heme-degrading monooxygenase HmoA
VDDPARCPRGRGAAVLPSERQGPSERVTDRIAATPEPPYVAVIFTSIRTEGDNGYAVMSARMEQLAAEQPGYLGIENARDGLGITVSYWADEASAQAWKQVAAHLVAQQRGRDAWYADYRVRVAVVHRDYGP